MEQVVDLDPDLPAAAPLGVSEVVHTLFIKPVYSSSVHKSVHKTCMTTVSVL